MSSVKLASGSVFPLLGLGTWKLTTGEVQKSVTIALECGYRHIDCAAIYGNEKEIGLALKDVFARKICTREEVFITSKLWNTCHKPELVKPALTKTLEDLELAYLDLYLIHWPVAFPDGDKLFPEDDKGQTLFDNETHYVQTYKAMEALVTEGMTKNIGISNFNSAQIKDILDNCTIKPAVHQFEVHPYFQQDKLVNFCTQHGIQVTGYSNFGSPDRPWADDKTRSIPEDSVIVGLGQKYKKSPAQIVLRWVVQRKIAAIPKSTNAERIRNNLDIFNFELADEDMAKIKSLDKNTRIVEVVAMVDGKPVSKWAGSKFYPFALEF